MLSCITNVKIEQQLQKFWETEAVDIAPGSTDDEQCLEFFRKNITRGADGRFKTAIPFRNEVEKLDRSRKMAVAQMLQLEKKFRANPAFEEQYVKCIGEYLSLNQMEKVTTTEDEMAIKRGDETIVS